MPYLIRGTNDNRWRAWGIVIILKCFHKSDRISKYNKENLINISSIIIIFCSAYFVFISGRKGGREEGYKVLARSPPLVVSEDIPHLHVEGNQIRRRPKAIIIKYAGTKKRPIILKHVCYNHLGNKKLATIFYFQL